MICPSLPYPPPTHLSISFFPSLALCPLHSIAWLQVSTLLCWPELVQYRSPSLTHLYPLSLSVISDPSLSSLLWNDLSIVCWLSINSCVHSSQHTGTTLFDVGMGLLMGATQLTCVYRVEIGWCNLTSTRAISLFRALGCVTGCHGNQRLLSKSRLWWETPPSPPL